MILWSRLPRAQAKRLALAQSIGEDGHRLLAAVWTPDAPDWLRRIWVQQFQLQDDIIHWRPADDTPPSGLFLNSPHDLDAHYARTDTISWVGYKAHLTETCDDDRPRIIMHVQTSPAPEADHRTVLPAHEALADRDLLPAQHLVDTGYTDAGLLIEAQQRFGIDLVGPMRRDVRWRAKAGGRFAIAAFEIDWAAERATCPRGITSSSWTPILDGRGRPGIKVKFSQRDCQPCPHRVDCAGPKAKRRLMSLRPQARHEALARARERQDTAAFARLYARRAGIEATLSLAVRRYGLRRARYAGLAKVCLQHVATAAALNLTRIVRWIAGEPVATTRRSHFGRLLTPVAAE